MFHKLLPLLALSLFSGCLSDASPRPPTEPKVVVLLRGRAATADLTALRAAHDAAFAAPTGANHLGHRAAILPAQDAAAPELLLVEELAGGGAAALSRRAEIRALFAAAPEVRVVSERSEWERWGPTPPVGAGAGRVLVVLRGTLASEESAARAVHDAFFAPRVSPLAAAGYERHHAFQVDGAPAEAVLLGVWTNAAAVQAAAADPSFGAFVGELFAGAPELSSFVTVDWTGWDGP